MTISISITTDLEKRLRMAAGRDHRSMSGQIAHLCEKGLAASAPRLEDDAAFIRKQVRAVARAGRVR